MERETPDQQSFVLAHALLLLRSQRSLSPDQLGAPGAARRRADCNEIRWRYDAAEGQPGQPAPAPERLYSHRFIHRRRGSPPDWWQPEKHQARALIPAANGCAAHFSPQILLAGVFYYHPHSASMKARSWRPAHGLLAALAHSTRHASPSSAPLTNLRAALGTGRGRPDKRGFHASGSASEKAASASWARYAGSSRNPGSISWSLPS